MNHRKSKCKKLLSMLLILVMIFGTSVPSFSGIKEKEETKETNIISEKESTEGFVSGEKIEKEISKLRNSEKAVTTTSQLTSIRTLKATGTTEEIGKRKSAVARAVGIGVDTLIEDHKDKERFYKGFSSKKDISEFVYITERYELSDEQVKYIAYATEKNYEELKEIFAMYEKDESLELPYFLLNKGIEERIEKAKVTTTSATKLRLEEIVEDVIYDENGKIIYKRGMETQEKSEETTTTSSTKLMTTNELSLKSTSTRSGLTMDLQNLQQYVKPLTSVSNGEGIAIDRETGNLTFSFDVGEMTYRDGLSEQLTLSYRLDDAASQQPYFNTNTRRHTQGSMSDTIRAFGIGAGWRLNLSFFINENDGLPSSGRGYLDAYKETLVDRVYLYDGRVVGVKQDENSDNIYEVEGEENKDLKFEVCDTAGEIYEFENGQTGEMPWSNLVKGYFIGMPSFKMVHKDGLVEYFNYKGQYLGKRDRNGNGYIVRYQKISHGGNLVKFFPSAVISNLGEKITLNLTGNKYGVSTIEQGNKVTEIQSTVEDSIWVGKSVKQKDKNNPSTSRTYTYTYQCYSSQFSFLTSLGHSGVDTAIPVEVVFPTGAKAIIDCYDYRVHIKDPETGNMTNGYVSKYGFSDIKFQNPSTGEIYNHETMDYETYLTQTVNNKNGIETTNDFNGEYLLGYKTLRENNKIIEKYSYWYTGSKDIRERTYTGYGLNTSEQRVTEETMTYSDNRNLLTYTDKIGVLHKYTYDATYNKCIKEETYKNNVLLKKIERTLDNKGNVTEENITAGGITKRTKYSYRYGFLLYTRYFESDGSYRTERRTIRTTTPDRYDTEGCGISNLELSYIESETISFTNNDGTTKNHNIKYTYDEHLNVESIEDEKGNEYTLTYDYEGRPLTVTDPEGYSKSFTYDDINNIYKKTNESGFEQRWIYDKFGNLLSQQDKINNVWVTKESYSYDNWMNQITKTDGNGNVTNYSYDPLFRIIEMKDGKNNSTTYSYDLYRNQNSRTTPDGLTIKETYDNNDNLVKEEQISGTETITKLYTYDDLDRKITETDGKGNTQNYTYNGLDQLIAVTNPLGEIVNYSYDSEGNLKGMSRYKNNNTGAVNTSKGYNGAFLLSNKTDELGRTELFDYDENYNITKHTDKLGAATIYTYDNLDRMTSWENRVEKCVYSYDSRSLLVQSVYYPDKSNVNSGETTTYSYTQDSKLQTKTLPDGKSITYSYDVQGNIVNINDYLGQNIIYTYDENNQIHTVTWNGLTFTYYYYPDGMIKKISYPTQSIQMEYTYDGFNRLIGTGIRKNGQIVQAYYNAYDKNSNVTVTNDGHGSTYTYDAVDRLKTATGGIRGENTTYNYNQLGDITGINSNLNIYPDLAVGNYTWNDRDNLTSYTGSNGTYTYKYNGEGLRTSKYKNSVKVTEYYYDEGNRVINEVEGTDNISIVYGHMPLARVVNGNIYYYLYNSHGDVVKVLDYSGNQINTYNYDEWGVMLSKSEGIKNDLTYFGQIYDDESKNYYLSSRYYDPSTKRFLSRDTYEGKLESPMSLNSYAYCQNNPLKYVDVNGHFVDTAIDLVSVGLSTVNMIQDPSVSNFIFLAWDIGAAALPFIPGSYVKKLGKLAGKVDDVVDLKNGKYLDDVIEGTGNLTNKISKSDLYSNYKKVEDKLKVLKDPNGNYARRAKELGYDNFNMDSWKKGIQSFKSADGLRIEYHFVKNIDDGTVIGEKIFKVIDGTREYLDILP